MGVKIELYRDHFQNFKRYGIPKAQLVIADIPYNLAENAFASNPQYKKRIVIAGIHGATDINYEMAMELSKHLKSLAEMYLEAKE